MPRKTAPQKNAPPKNCPTPDNSPPPPPTPPPPKKRFNKIFVAFDIILPLFLFFLQLFMVTSFRGESRSPATSIIDLLVTVGNDINYCHKNLQFRGCRAHRFALSLLGEGFQRYLSVRHIVQLVTHGKTVKSAKSVLCKIIGRKDIIFNKQF